MRTIGKQILVTIGAIQAGGDINDRVLARELYRVVHAHATKYIGKPRRKQDAALDMVVDLINEPETSAPA